MSSGQSGRIPALLAEREDQLLEQWVREQLTTSSSRLDLLSEADVRRQSTDFLRRFGQAVQTGNLTDIRAPEWAPVRELLAEISRSRALQGFLPGETASFVFSFKQPLFNALRETVTGSPESLMEEVWSASTLIDKLGLLTTEIHQVSREEVIRRQQQELMELSTPVVKLWEGVVAVPLIGTLDSARTQVVMENLLQRIVETGARIAIVDITGVPTVDTLVAQHLIKTVAAARLMGADCIISGIRPQIAQTIVHLGITLQDVVTKATLADAISLALQQSGYTITRATARG